MLYVVLSIQWGWVPGLVCPLPYKHKTADCLCVLHWMPHYVCVVLLTTHACAHTHTALQLSTGLAAESPWDEVWSPSGKYIHTYIHTYVHTYICIYIHMYIHTYVHTYSMFQLEYPTYVYVYVCSCNNPLGTVAESSVLVTCLQSVHLVGLYNPIALHHVTL